ncbi:hypothetical protein [Hymenobacter crusticola]|uniref:Uncharacterized protein n=1 Tax=Hymenobacter crusticola TaxID=1770526 RepID=A0A243WEX5_9BACT|nr:hypothetical protein [Hymenobacter crusticola]OUJ74263.1 hypothetical protein BXP70_11115 [Hymenobacter crusticola]
MKSVRQAIQKSWFPELRILRSDLGTSLQLGEPLSLTALTRHLDQPEERRFQAPLDADALHGEVEFIIRSDGTYTFRGHVRATGFPSFAYRVQATIRSPSAGIVVMAQTSGRVFGTDTPGDRQRSWEENNSSPSLRQFWMGLRADARLETNLQKDLSGVTGAVVDVVTVIIETYVAAQFAGAVGAVLVLGVELGAAAGQTFINPNVLAGITVGAGILLVFGPGAIIPALVAGTGTALLADIRSRSMNEAEIALARTVFRDTLPFERIKITDLYTPSHNASGFVAREFVVPGIDGSILVNMGKNFDHTLEVDAQRGVRDAYPNAGEVFIHELTHAWQIHHSSFTPGLLCEALLNRNYHYDKARVSARAPWSDFGPEEQASIVNEWFGANNNSNLESPQALNDERFFYVAQNIRVGHT